MLQEDTTDALAEAITQPQIVIQDTMEVEKDERVNRTMTRDMKKRSGTGLFILMLVLMMGITGCGERADDGQDVLSASGTPKQEAVSVDEPKLQGPYDVVRVVDGDTVVVNIDGTDEKLRLIGVDTPESVHPDPDKNVPYGKIASQFSKDMLKGKSVQLEYDVEERDRYGRLLVYVYLDGEMYNKRLLEEGHAELSTFPPNVKYVDDFTQLQETARQEGKGLWGEAGLEAQVVSPTQAGTESSAQAELAYIGNNNTKKFHRSDCTSVTRMKEGNKVTFQTRDEAVTASYQPCGNCHP